MYTNDGIKKLIFNLQNESLMQISNPILQGSRRSGFN
jgi:hypothetical protein